MTGYTYSIVAEMGPDVMLKIAAYLLILLAL
jgi:hypothetical protein